MTDGLLESGKTLEGGKINSSLEAVILDVGHGNCALIRDGHRCLVVDVAKESELLAEIERSGVTRIEHLVVSHADDDHVRGALKLLPRDEISIGTVWFNPDSSKNTRTWRAFVALAHDLYEAGRVNVSTSINVAARELLSFGRVDVEVLHPDILFSGLGTRGARHGGRTSNRASDYAVPKITSNGMSVVLRIRLGGQPALLLPGDLDSEALDRVLLRQQEISAPVLVFPHHGGHCGGASTAEFARSLCGAVKPEMVAISLGRGRYGNPLPEVIEAIRDTLPQARIACTQVSTHCQAADLPTSSCAGSVFISMSEGGDLGILPASFTHSEFVAGLDSPMCGVGKIFLPIPRFNGDG
ncbi:ComEC/Rec2 family competence protein [Streptomyces sp. NPDC093591]|uniref:ComEC/Rec2 family competence protein n=1 Tax=Streptomyces sp. NPDC093591 TaxID=3366044 RepID=UPI00381A1670